MFKLDVDISLKHCPCSIEFVNKWNAFVIGTYELNDELKEEFLNKRNGSLALIKDNELTFEKSCRNGGVFDFRILNDGDQLNLTTIRLYAAHSNGNLTLNEIVKLGENKFELNEISCIDTQSSMLTCLDLIRLDSSDVLIAVGDSHFTLILIKNQQILNKIKINQFDYPIWCIKILNLASQFLVFTGSDDCALRCFAFENDEFQDHTLLLKADSFDGGVTSIELAHSLSELEANKTSDDEKHEIRDLVNTNSNYTECNVLLVGSYDEKLRIYEFKLTDNQKLDYFKLNKTISIKNAGIWKLKHHLPCDFYLITGMYSGVHLVKDDKLILTFNELPIVNSQPINEVKNENEHLVYGSCFNQINFNQFLIASFYKKKVYCFAVDKRAMNELLRKDIE